MPANSHGVSDRLFFAVFPDAEAIAAIAASAASALAQVGRDARALRPGRWHVTCAFLGGFVQVPEALLARAGQAADTLDQAPFEACFDRIASFAGQRRSHPLVLLASPVRPGLWALRRQLVDGLRGCGVAFDERDYRPHVTLCRVPRRMPVQEVEPVAWVVRELVLVQSRSGEPGYRRLARWPLPARSR